jgi:hypothetical protein
VVPIPIHNLNFIQDKDRAIFNKLITEPVQVEVLLEEGYFKQLGTSQPILENGVPKIDADGTEWFEVYLEELGTPLRTIN